LWSAREIHVTDSKTRIPGETRLIQGPAPVGTHDGADFRSPGSALSAAVITGGLTETAGLTVIVSTSETRADELARALKAMAPAVEVLVLPPWDCLPYDHASPSRDCQGRRLDVLRRLSTAPVGPRLLVVSPEAAMQRLPPAAARNTTFTLRADGRLDRDALLNFALAAGYVEDDRIDEPGEIALLGEVVDVYPPSATLPARLTLEGDRIATLRTFDPLSQRSQDDLETVTLGAASEWIQTDGAAREPGCEHRLGQAAGPLETLFDLAGGDAHWVLENGAAERCRLFLDQVIEAHHSARTFGDGGALPPPTSLYLSALEADQGLARADPIPLPDRAAGVPAFALDRHPGRALKAFVAARQEVGRRIAISGAPHELKTLGGMLRRHGLDASPVSGWTDVLAAEPAAIVSIEADFAAGFDAPDADLTLITASDILGGRVSQTSGAAQSLIGEPDLRVGDVVIHEDHGLGVLEALDRISVDGFERDVIRLAYHGGATLLAPVEEFGRIWRYGSEPDAVTLDRPGSDGWRRRRAEVSAQIDRTAARLVELAAAREAARTDPVVPPRQAYARFAAGFPFPESVDQAAAITGVIDDLASGRPMNRLVCGDVGFGKTEVALRAAAAVALTGRQVVVAAPTTVLARQHYEVFRRRFRDLDISVAHLSRLVEPGEAAVVRAGLADGSIRIAVGTQALAADSLEFADLGLVVIDEEQRFGAKMKDALRARAAHGLTLTATPIPRTLQSALVGLIDVSVIASPPARRRPIRTTLTGLDDASLRTALLREKRRGGQSFVVCPRIDDLDPMAETLARLVPELRVRTAHGKMPVADVDAAMVGFAEGRGDILLATNIVESGLDVPRANTIVVWRPDRFGLAQLHQLRGRVGRGRAQGFAYMLTDPQDDVSEATLARLATLEAFDRLGSGFAISARDLDLRGGGDLVGDEQAGHMKMIGAALYQQVLERAVRAARGEPVVEAWPPPPVDATAFLPVEYIPDATVRINLYARLARVRSAAEAEALEDEMADRFGPIPPPVASLLEATRVSALAADAGVTRIASGPKATAFTLAADRLDGVRARLPANDDRRWVEDRLIFDAREDVPHDSAFIAGVLSELAA
jgi:transcription-repair coupling factor (superfamily II helicase)